MGHLAYTWISHPFAFPAFLLPMAECPMSMCCSNILLGIQTTAVALKPTVVKSTRHCRSILTYIGSELDSMPFDAPSSMQLLSRYDSLRALNHMRLGNRHCKIAS